MRTLKRLVIGRWFWLAVICACVATVMNFMTYVPRVRDRALLIADLIFVVAGVLLIIGIWRAATKNG